jgi:glycosyltransferase involved in cell wall biosynthesis
MSREFSPLVSIVIPCYNNAAFVRSAIDSALNQTYSQIETIVIDDGSKDESLEIIRSYGDRVRWETIPNQGAPKARNRGVELAQGKYIKFLDADDLLLPEAIDRQVKLATELSTEHKAIIYGDALRIDAQGNPLPSYALQRRQPNGDPIAHILSHCPLTSCPLHQKTYLQAIGGFDPKLPRGQEHDLHLRLVLSGVEFVHHPHPIYQYREYTDPNRISNHAYSRTGAMVHYQAIEKHIHAIEQQTDKPLTAQVKRILAQRLWRYGRGILREGGHNEANEYFKLARQLDEKNCVTGQSPYPLLVRLFGTQRAEVMFARVKSLLNPGIRSQ